MHHPLSTSLSRYAIALFLASLPLLGLAHEYQAGSLHIAHPYSRATPPGSPHGAGYLRIENRGTAPDRWLSVTSPRANRVELHKSVEKDGMSSMVHTGLPVVVEPGSELTLEPGSYHLMLMGLSSPLKAGEEVPLTLTFENAGEVEVELKVDGLGKTEVQTRQEHSDHGSATR